MPGGVVKSGINRLVDSFLKEIQNMKNSKLFFNYYYFEANEIAAPRPTAGLAMTKWAGKRIFFKKLPRRFYGSLFLPLNTLIDDNDIFLGFSGYIPYLLSRTKIKKIVFLYDLGFLKYPKFYPTSKKLIINTAKAIESADKVVVLSDYAKEEITDRFPQAKRKIVRIYAGANHLMRKDNSPMIRIIEAERHSSLKDFFLYVGVIKPIKNIEKLCKIFGEFIRLKKYKKYRLVLIGKKEEEYFEKLTESGTYREIKSKIEFLEDVLDEELIEYYINSTALLNFSHEEGLCFPVLEALSLGKKVIVNDLVIYREFKKHFNNLLIGSTEKEIVNLISKATREKKKSDFGLANPPKSQFRWKNFCNNLLSLVSE